MIKLSLCTVLKSATQPSKFVTQLPIILPRSQFCSPAPHFCSPVSQICYSAPQYCRPALKFCYPAPILLSFPSCDYTALTLRPSGHLRLGIRPEEVTHQPLIWRLPVSIKCSNVIKGHAFLFEQTPMHHLGGRETRRALSASTT